LSTKYQGGTVKLVIIPAGNKAKFTFEIKNPALGNVKAEGTLVAGIMRASFSFSSKKLKGNGKFTLEKTN